MKLKIIPLPIPSSTVAVAPTESAIGQGVALSKEDLLDGERAVQVKLTVRMKAGVNGNVVVSLAYHLPDGKLKTITGTRLAWGGGQSTVIESPWSDLDLMSQGMVVIRLAGRATTSAGTIASPTLLMRARMG